MDEDDDYWNTSETKAKAFSFDDDVLSPQEILAIGQKSYPGQSEDNLFSNINISTVKTAGVTIRNLLSPKVLDLILLAQSGMEPTTKEGIEVKKDPQESVEVTLKKLILGRNCSIDVHRSMKSKKELLDGATALGDGNVLLTVILFLIKTLNKKLVYELLSSRPLALNHYIGFLHSEGKITELADLLTMLGRSPEAAMYQFYHIVKTQGNNVDGLLRKLTNLLANHFNQPGVDAYQTKMLADYIKLLEWQKHVDKEEIRGASVLRCLAWCCARHWSEGAGSATSPLTLCQRHQISPIQYDWVVLNVHAKAAKWDLIESLYTKKDWLGRSAAGSHVPAGRVVSRLGALGGGAALLAACLAPLPVDDRLRLAHAYKIHTVVIETLAKQKDRAALTNYKVTLSPQSEEYILAENTLRDKSIKWKN